MPMYVQFREWRCNLVFHEYRNGRTAIELVDTIDGALVATASVNVPEAALEPGQVLIKDWSENEGMLKTLVDAGVVADTGQSVPTGWVQANVCKLLVHPKEG